MKYTNYYNTSRIRDEGCTANRANSLLPSPFVLSPMQPICFADLTINNTFDGFFLYATEVQVPRAGENVSSAFVGICALLIY